MSYALTNRSWKDSYKNILQFKNASFSGVKSSYQKVIDGFGSDTPLELNSASGVRISQGYKLVLQDDGNIYFERTGADKLALKAGLLSVTGSVSVTGRVRAASAVIPNISATGIIAASIIAERAAAGNASFGSASLGAVYGTTASFSLIKGNASLTSLKSASIVFGGTGLTQVKVAVGDGASAIDHFGGAKTIIREKTKTYPAVDDEHELGGTSNRYKLTRVVTAYNNTTNTERLYVTAGGILSNLSRIRAISCYANNYRAVSSIVSPTYYFDAARAVYLNYNVGIEAIETIANVVPTTNASLSVGTATRRFNNLHVVTASATLLKGATASATLLKGTTASATNLKGGILTAGTASFSDQIDLPVKVFAVSIPASSVDLEPGQVYQIAGELKVVT